MQVRWSPWEPAPEHGASTWRCSGTVTGEGDDTIRGQLLASEDHDALQTWSWGRNGKSPRLELAEDLHAAAMAHSETAPKGHHMDPPVVAGSGGVGIEPEDGSGRGMTVAPIEHHAAGSTPAGSTEAPGHSPGGDPWRLPSLATRVPHLLAAKPKLLKGAGG
mgnify:CR=1 FL=1